MRLLIENVRCFHALQDLPIRPLTFLVGENSTGKTTFLAAYRIAWEVIWGVDQIDFNEPPFELGTYDQIANVRRGRGGRAKSFKIGFAWEAGSVNRRIGKSLQEPDRVYANFAKGEAQPVVSSRVIETQDTKLIMFRDADKGSRLRLEIGNRRIDSDPIPIPAFSWFSFISFGRYPLEAMFNDSLAKGKLTHAELEPLTRILRSFRRRPATPRALAPIRSKPERVYSKMTDTSTPTGEHTPMILSRALGKNGSSNPGLYNNLKRFGKASGLFGTLQVKQFGGKEGNPFQLLVADQGPPFNLVDVGYGVSQILPILVDSISESGDTVFLLQQPEVHLHPRAQAELATHFGNLASSDRKKFIVETHSDYILDRVRLDIRDGKSGLKPEDVVILYFEKVGAEARIHPVFIDRTGNIQDAPPGYRQFFMEEEKRYFGV